MTNTEHCDLQRRLDEALREDPRERARSSFSPYQRDPGIQLSYRLADAAQRGGAEGLAAMLDLRDELIKTDDPLAVRHAMMIVLTHFPGGLTGTQVSPSERSINAALGRLPPAKK